MKLSVTEAKERVAVYLAGFYPMNAPKFMRCDYCGSPIQIHDVIHYRTVVGVDGSEKIYICNDCRHIGG